MLSMINTYKYNILDLSSLNIFLWCVYLYVLNTLHHITGKKISTHPKAELKQALVLCETSCVTLERFDLWISRSELRDGWSDTFQMCSPTHVACSWGCDEFVLWVHKCHPFAQILAIWGLSYSAISSINLFIYIYGMVLKSCMYPRYQWLWKAKQPGFHRQLDMRFVQC